MFLPNTLNMWFSSPFNFLQKLMSFSDGGNREMQPLAHNFANLGTHRRRFYRVNTPFAKHRAWKAL